MKCLILKVNGNLFFFSLKCFVPFPVKYKYWIRNVLFSLTKYFQSFLSDGEGRSYFIVQAWRLHITFIKKNFFFREKLFHNRRPYARWEAMAVLCVRQVGPGSSPKSGPFYYLLFSFGTYFSALFLAISNYAIKGKLLQGQWTPDRNSQFWWHPRRTELLFQLHNL